MDVQDDYVAIRMRDSLDSYSLAQYVSEPTHRLGHTLDLVITRASENIVSDIHVDKSLPSDHYAVTCLLKISRPQATKKSVCFRKVRDINLENFRNDITASRLISDPADNIDTLCVQFHQVLSELLDLHAPKVTKCITLRPFAPWYDDEIRTAKRERRRCERQYLKSGLIVHKDLYQEQCRRYKDLLDAAKTSYHRSQLADCDHRQLFRAVDKLCSANTSKKLPSHDDSAQLANDFANFFVDKIDKVHNKLDHLSSDHLQSDLSSPPAVFAHFSEVSQETVRKIIMESPSSTCDLDCIPTWFLKSCINELLPSITQIVNLSLSSGVFPSPYKVARVTPLIKKPSLDKEDLSNYRPISTCNSFLKSLNELEQHNCNNIFVKMDFMEGCNRHIVNTIAPKPHCYAYTMTFFAL
jgi:hypothetical protein